MAKKSDDTFIDAPGADLDTNASAMHVCSAEPTDRANAIATSLATVAMDAGDYSQADGDTNGRKTIVAQQAAISITSTGTATHVALIDATTRLIYVTTCTSQLLTSGGTVTVPAWDIEIADPT